MIRTIIAVVVGCIVGIILILISRVMIFTQYPFPSDLDWYNSIDRNTYFLELPVIGLWLHIFAHALAGFFSGLLASIIARKSRKAAGVVAIVAIIIYLLITQINYTLPHWYDLTDIIITFLAGLLGAFIGGKRTV